MTNKNMEIDFSSESGSSLGVDGVGNVLMQYI